MCTFIDFLLPFKCVCVCNVRLSGSGVSGTKCTAFYLRIPVKYSHLFIAAERLWHYSAVVAAGEETLEIQRRLGHRP